MNVIRTSFIITVLASAVLPLSACVHDTNESIHADPSETGTFQVTRDYLLVSRDIATCFQRKYTMSFPAAEIHVERSTGQDVSTVNLVEEGFLGRRMLFVADIKPIASGSEITFYKSGALGPFTFRKKIETWANGDAADCGQ